MVKESLEQQIESVFVETGLEIAEKTRWAYDKMSRAIKEFSPKSFVYDSIRCSYGTYVTFFRVATFAKKWCENRTILQPDNKKPIKSYFGAGIGAGIGLASYLMTLNYFFDKAANFDRMGEDLKGMLYFSIPAFFPTMFNILYEVYIENKTIDKTSRNDLSEHN